MTVYVGLGISERQRTVKERAYIAAIRRWVSIYGEPPAAPDWDTSSAAQLRDKSRADRAVLGGWPSVGAVIKTFGTWNAAIEAAGFTPRRAGGFAENWSRRRDAVIDTHDPQQGKRLRRGRLIDPKFAGSSALVSLRRGD